MPRGFWEGEVSLWGVGVGMIEGGPASLCYMSSAS